VYNTPGGPTLAVAELTVGLVLNLLRRVGEMDAAVRRGQWEKLMGNLLCGKRVGVIGFGRIGQKVAELLSAFGVELAYCDLEEKSCAVRCSPKGLGDLLGWADIVTLHVSPPASCSPVIGEREIGAMKKGAWLVNVSRGGLVDEGALYRALSGGRLAGAALDVFGEEPYRGPLKELKNVILTPHVGSYALEARTRMEEEAVDNLLMGLGEEGPA
jgi:D-3-phosphoglycerate dehydrogenase